MPARILSQERIDATRSGTEGGERGRDKSSGPHSRNGAQAGELAYEEACRIWNGDDRAAAALVTRTAATSMS